MKKYDFVVIGSGLGGLCAAIILAKENKKVLVLEQHFKPGGYLHSFKRHGWQFETGFHFSPELGSSQILQMYWQYLGVLDKIELVPYNREHFHSLRFPDFHLDLHSGIDSLQELLNKKVFQRIVFLNRGQHGMRSYEIWDGEGVQLCGENLLQEYLC